MQDFQPWQEKRNKFAEFLFNFQEQMEHKGVPEGIYIQEMNRISKAYKDQELQAIKDLGLERRIRWAENLIEIRSDLTIQGKSEQEIVRELNEHVQIYRNNEME
jgi:hypothetical protein